MEEKCTCCKEKKTINDFTMKKDRDGNLVRKAWCIHCSNIQKKSYRKNRKKIIKKIREYNQQRDDGLYVIYWSMKSRCKHKSQVGYKYYGGRGIIVEWKTYQDFKKDMYRKYKNHLVKYGKRQTTLDRIDFNGNYSKENCRWATYKVQANNKSNNKK